MPKNRIIYIGILIVAAAALLYVGSILAKMILEVGILPWAAGVGILLIIVGVFLEARKGKEALKPGEESAESVVETTM